MHEEASSADRVLRLRIELVGVTPLVWREIEVPADYDFWALHVAIQDAMGWTDSHLHQFVLDPRSGDTESLVIGLPDPDAPAEGPRAGWDYPIGPFVHRGAPAIDYHYDFGDDWRHRIECIAEHEGGTGSAPLPRCVGGARACPPEDCGGPPGYEHLLAVLALPAEEVSEEDRELLEWIEPDFDPEAFEPGEVVFEDPRERLATLLDPIFGDEDGDEMLGFTPGRFDQHSLDQEVIDETWIETAEFGPRHSLKTYDDVARRQPHLLSFVLDETEGLGEEARSLAHFVFVTVYRMFFKAGGKRIGKISRARIEKVGDLLDELEQDTLSDPEVTLYGLDGELSGQPILNEFLADLLSDDAPDTAAAGLSDSERDVLFDRMRVVVEALDAELRK